MGIDKTKQKLLYMSWISAMQPKEWETHHRILRKPWEVVGADIFPVHNKNYLCIVDYHSRFSIIKKTEDLSSDSLILEYILIFLEHGLPRKIMSDAGSNLISEKFEKFCKKWNIECAALSSYHHQSNG